MENYQERLSLEESLQQYDQSTIDTNSIRKQIIDKLYPVMLDTDFKADDKTDPELYTAKSKMLGELRQLLNDTDASRYKHASLKLKKKENEDSNRVSVDVVEILRKVKLGAFPSGDVVINNPSEAESIIDETLTKQGCVIMDTELTQDKSGLPERETDDF